ncbi:hypothetical protein P168DRAFT_313405 [Aspergillus campestris IBT 28561]|uniref:Uncharacterized protein n=1 Tax=Aspergillus campestris (strain IBT 28561) TaxID=1392248 RepID=A0A2I1CSN3_ASPC2|nr:uncharacterized protein P168DRAFT_313405 [Aspergillus campestris IBT 28561]PKY00636.1 hypothetical protein P168DRAFT_313405 [Aspergillus campestris IBT 28561]
MRYENWDVLLFPDTSKIPIQEFKTQCFVTKDRDSPYLHNPSLDILSYLPSQSTVGLLPVLTTFIPSLPHNTPFRVSIHSWDKPRASRLMETMLQPDDSLLFEIRIFIDGLCVSGSVFSQRTSWPHVIDIDKSGNQDHLRFPPFHSDILEQRHWDAGDLHGRVRIVISEGFSRPHRSPPFERVKELIVFAFQHAPLHVLEYSSIAWPNASMWSREPRLFKYNTGSGLVDKKELDDSHAHSPTRHGLRQVTLANSQASSSAVRNSWPYRDYYYSSLGPAPQWQGNPAEPRITPPESFMPDPFIDPYMLDPSARHRGARPSWEDVSMPDYAPSSGSSRALSSMTGVSYEHSKNASLVTPIDEESYTQFVEALSPPKPLASGTHAPANTPSGASLPMGTKLSAAAEARSASYAKPSKGVSVLKKISNPPSREVSESSVKSTLPPEMVAENPATGKPRASPSAQVKGRKERLPQDKENETAEAARRDIDRLTPTPAKATLARTSTNLEAPVDPRVKRSAGSRRGSTSIPKGEPVLLSPVLDLTSIGDVAQPAIDNGVGSTTEAAEIE